MQQRPASSNTGCLVAAAVLGLSIIVATAIVAYALTSTGRAIGGAFDRANPANAIATGIAQATPTIIVRPPALVQVRALNELATAQQLMSTVVEVEKARVGDVIYERLVLIACGKVKAGINLSDLNDSNVVTDGDVVTIRLPQAQLQDIYLVDDASQPCTTKVYDRTNLIILQETRELEQQAREKALVAIRDASVQAGVLEEARRNAKLSIERVLLRAGYRQVVFIDK
jgi:hypothetical protein